MDSTALLKSSSSSALRPKKPCYNSNVTSTPQFNGFNKQKLASLSQNGKIQSAIADLHNTSAPRSLTSAPVPQNLTSFPYMPESDSNTNWSYPNSNDGSVGIPTYLTLGSAQSFTSSPSQLTDSNTIRSNSSYPTNMSAFGIQPYDANYDNFNIWPQFELQDQLFSPMQSPGILYEEPELLAPSAYSRSPSSSPPHSMLSVEQRELKRQHRQARRESKTYLRRARSVSSNSKNYSISQRTSPDLLSKSEYANSVTPSPLLSQCSIQNSPAIPSTPFLSSYSPEINSQIPTDIYGQPFTVSPSNFTSAMSNFLPFSASSQPEASLSGYLDRSQNLPLNLIPDHMGVYCPPTTDTAAGTPEVSEPVRVVHSRPKPQCWEHGCNGRQFSTFSNLLRHQREKSGAAQKSSCPHCGAEFTRTTARNGHLAHDKCKQRKSS